MKVYKFKINGLDCANCANRLERILKKMDMIHNVTISFMMERLTFECLEEDKKNAVEKIKIILKREEPDVKLEEV